MSDSIQKPGCLGAILRIFGFKVSIPTETVEELPYKLRECFLSPAELAFYRVLEIAIAQEHSINCKVRLWDLVCVPRYADSRKFENKVSSKHLDFLLCDRKNMQPLLAIELDDASHSRQDRQQRDQFLDQIMLTVGVPILHVPAARSYDASALRDQIQRALQSKLDSVAKTKQTLPPPIPVKQSATSVKAVPPNCPKCESTMVLRTAAKGANVGKRFWACSNYPRCRNILPID